MDVALGGLYPLSRPGGEHDLQLAKAILEAGIIAETFEGGCLRRGVLRACCPCMPPTLHAAYPLPLSTCYCWEVLWFVSACR